MRLPILLIFFIPLICNCQVISNKTLKIQSSTCEEKLFFNLYNSAPDSPLSYDMISTSDSGVIVIGLTQKFNPNNQYDGLITKINKSGFIEWSRVVDGPWTQTLVSITRLNDGNFVIIGAMSDNVAVGFFLLKIDINGNMIWRKDYRIPLPGESFDKSIIKEDADGSLIIVTKFRENGLSFSDRLLFIKADATGNILFTKFYTPSNPVTIMHVNDLVIRDGYSYVAGLFLLQNNFKGLFVKINNSTGNLTWSKFYDFNNGEAEFTQIFPNQNNKFCLIGNDDINPKDTSLIYIIDTSGSCSSSKYFQFNTGFPRQFGSAAPTANDEIIWSMYYYRLPTNLTTITLSRINPLTGIIYSRDFPQLNLFPTIWKTTLSADSSIYCTGNKDHIGGLFLPFLAKFSKSGELGCPFVPIQANFGNGTTIATNLSMNTTNKSFPPIPIGTMSQYSLIKADSLCTFINICDTLKIHGEDTVCNIQQEVFFTAYKNPFCAGSVNWQIDPTPIQIFQQINDTTLKLQFNQPWQGYLYAKIQTACGTVSDSLFLVVLNSPGSVNLGPDSSICPNNILILNAHSGYLSYLWQDGSSDSTFSVTAPGLYWVEVKDACNNISRDSVIVTAAPPVPLDIGPDLNKCNNDSLTISAPAGFINYTWSPNYNINTTTGPVVIVFPAIDTMYKLKAEKTPGCFAFDSVRITVKLSPTINLGADTSFCNGDSLVLNAGGGFTNYNWSTGQTSPIIIAFTTGSYSIIAMAANGCTSKDTLKILNVYNNPVIILGPDSPICEGNTRELNAGSGFNNYLWSNGSSAQSIFASIPGTYWVIVTDNKNCKGGDTTSITAILPTPKNFLPADTVICSYSSMSLTPLTSYSAYLWSTGSNSASIVVSYPGNYWLQVIASTGCTGKDTIIVNPKQCLEGFYIPTAFTPNNDGKNDLFRPLLFGNVLKYEFIIYNRWGAIVFRTKDLQKGWNGKVNGFDTDSNIFVWQCNFQFEGYPPQLKKGIVALIH